LPKYGRAEADPVLAEARARPTRAIDMFRGFLANKQTLGDRGGPITEYLLERIDEDPGRTLEVFQLGCGRTTEFYLAPEISNKLDPYMVKAVSVGLEGEVVVQDYQERDRLLRTLRILVREGRHRQLLRKLMSSEACYEQQSTVSDGTKSITKTARIRFLADAAKRELLRMGEVP
jgi:hypothetical protein